MNLQSERRHEPYPWTYEIPVAAAAVLALVGVPTIHLGRALANLFAGQGWTWPASGLAITSLRGVITGDGGAGIVPALPNPASSGAVIAWVVTSLIVMLIGVGVLLRWVLRKWGPGRMKGMASAAEAEAILGVGRLKKNRKIIRPDLFAPASTSRGHDGYHPRSKGSSVELPAFMKGRNLNG